MPMTQQPGPGRATPESAGSDPPGYEVLGCHNCPCLDGEFCALTRTWVPNSVEERRRYVQCKLVRTRPRPHKERRQEVKHG